MTTITTPRPTDVDSELRKTLTALDHEALGRQFIEQGEFLLVEDFVPPALLTETRDIFPGLEPLIHRNFVPRIKKGGSPWHRFVSHMKDGIAYFGFRQVFRWGRRNA